MSDSSRPKYAGEDLPMARALLEGAAIESFDRDFIAIDAAGRIAVFLGDPESAVPSPSVARTTAAVLEEIPAAVRARLSVREGENGYRDAAALPVELVFDTPQSAPRTPLHETPVAHYPQLIVATPGGERIVRGLLDDYRGRELLARDGFAIALEVLGPVSSEEIHAPGACAGCRVLADPADPHPRSPEALATMGFYVYAFAGGAWIRVVSPGIPVDRDDLPDMKLVRASIDAEAIVFDETPWLAGRWFHK